MGLELKTEKAQERVLIRASGEVDLYTSPDLRNAVIKALKQAGQGGIGIDLGGVEYMDSSGVATLVEGLKSTKKKGAPFTLVAPSESVMKVLKLARLDSVFTIEAGA